jgi:hypothetical protein
LHIYIDGITHPVCFGVKCVDERVFCVDEGAFWAWVGLELMFLFFQHSGETQPIALKRISKKTSSWPSINPINHGSNK